MKNLIENISSCQFEFTLWQSAPRQGLIILVVCPVVNSRLQDRERLGVIPMFTAVIQHVLTADVTCVKTRCASS